MGDPLFLVFVTKGFPELLIGHDPFMLGTPMSIYTVPPISLKGMVTDGGLSWPLHCYFFFTAEAFKILFHVFSKFKDRSWRRLTTVRTNDSSTVNYFSIHSLINVSLNL
jgi:hypothetical protein